MKTTYARNVSMIPAKNFVATLAGNVNNPNLTDKDFRDLVRNTLPIVKYEGHMEYTGEDV